jgi:predicted nuclease with TOPRIM domain
MSPLELEADSLELLEERIRKAAQLVSRLREERDAAVEQAARAKAETARLAEELRRVQGERKQARTRIEKLLAQIDELGAG